MSGAQKISLSLLISVVVFAALAVLVAVDRFQLVVAQFYIPRVEESVRVRAERATELFDEFHRANIALFEEFTREPAVQAAFRINASSEEIRERENRLDTVEQERSSLDVVRIINSNATELHYSSESDDYVQSGTRRSYLRPDQASAGEPLTLSALAYSQSAEPVTGASAEAVGAADIFLEPTNNQFIYRLPAIDANGVVQGAALFYVNTSDLRTTLVRAGLVGIGDRVLVVNASGVVANAPSRFGDELVAAAEREWAAIAAVADEAGRVTLTNDAASDDRDAASDDRDAESVNGVSLSYEAFGVGSQTDGVVVFLEPSASLQMPELLQYTLLVAVFLTTFLIVFLLLNVRQDAIVVISDRVKRFQISLLREYMEKRREIDFHRWKKELEDRRDEVHREIRRGIGRVRASQEEEVNELINESWDEIISVLGSRAEERPTVSLDVDRIEEIVNQLSDRLSHMNLGRAPASATIPATPPTPRPVQVEEVSDDDAVEAEDLGEVEELDEVEGVEELDEADEVDELEEADEVDELEEVDEAEELTDEAPLVEPAESGTPGSLVASGTPVEVEELDDADDVDELDEADELEEPPAHPPAGTPVEVEEIREADLTEELDELEDAGELDEAEVPDETGSPDEVDEVEEAEEPEQVEELGELDEVEELDELEEPEEAEEAEEPEEARALEEVDEVEEVEELDDVDAPGRVREGTVASLDSLDEATELEWLGRTESAELPRAALSDLHQEGFPPPELEAETLEDEVEDLGIEELSPWEEPDVAEPHGTELEEAEPVDDLPPGEEELEYLDPDDVGGEPDAPEELPDAERATTTFGSGLFSFGRGVDVRNPAVPTPRRPEEMAPDHTPGGLIRFTDAREGVRSDYEIASLDSILDRLNVDRRVLVETDGVIEIGRDVYSGGGRGHDVETRDLVDSIIGGDAEDQASGIEMLFGGGSDDLLPELRKQETTTRRQTGVSLFRFVEQGFDYDAFLRGYQPTDSGVLKSMVRFTRFWNARIGLLLLNADNRLLPSFQLGMDPRCADALAITRSSGLFRNVLDRRNVLLVRQPIANVEYFHGLCRPENLSLFERSLFLPIVFRGEPAYALLGLSREMDSIEHVFRQIVPRLSRPQGAMI